MKSHHIYRRLEAFLVSSMDRVASCSILAFLRESPATKNKKNSIKSKNCCKLSRVPQEKQSGKPGVERVCDVLCAASNELGIQKNSIKTNNCCKLSRVLQEKQSGKPGVERVCDGLCAATSEVGIQKNSIKTKNCCKLSRMLQDGKCGRHAWCGDGECRRRRCAASIRGRRIQNNSMKSKIFASKIIGTRIAGHLRCSMRNIANNSIKTNTYTSASNAPSSARPPPSIQRHRIGSMWFLFPVF